MKGLCFSLLQCTLLLPVPFSFTPFLCQVLLGSMVVLLSLVDFDDLLHVLIFSEASLISAALFCRVLQAESLFLRGCCVVQLEAIQNGAKDADVAVDADDQNDSAASGGGGSCA